MKKTFTAILLLVLSVIAFAEPAVEPAKRSFLQEFISMDFKKLVSSEETIHPLIKEGVSYAKSYGGEIDFRWFYNNVRGNLYSILGLKRSHKGQYFISRTILISKAKEYLHQGDNLQEIFSLYRPFIQSQIMEMDLEERVHIRLKLLEAVETFELLKDDEIKKKFRKLLDKKAIGVSSDFGGLDLLSRNLSSKETVAFLLSDENSVGVEHEYSEESSFEAIFEDPNLAKFAGRRMIEGGNELLDKYINVLTLLIEDVRIGE